MAYLRMSASTRVRGGNLYTILALALLAITFAINASSWVQFYRSNGSHVGLFTQTDFPGIVIGAKLVASGQGAQLYDLDAQLREQQRMVSAGYLSLAPTENAQLNYPYPYTPFIAVLWSPLAALSPLVGMAIWDLLNIATMVGGYWLLLTSLPLPQTTRLLLLLAAITCFPFITNLEQGQSSGLVMLGFAAGISLARRGNDLPAGLAFGLLALKVQWLPLLLLLLLWKRRWWTLLGISLTVLFLFLLTFVTIGTSWIPGYLTVLQEAQQWSRVLLLDPQASHSLGGGLTALLGHGAEGLVRTTNIVATLAIATLLLFIWRGPWEPTRPRWDGAMALTFLASIFTNLHVNTHDLCLLSLPAGLGLCYIYQSQQTEAVKIAWYVLLWSAYLIPTFLLPETFSNSIRLTTLVMGLMIVVLAWQLMRSLQTIRIQE